MQNRLPVISNCAAYSERMLIKQICKRYERFFGIEGVQVRKILRDSSEANIECSFEHYPNCGFFNVIGNEDDQGFTQSSFVSLCRKEKIGNYFEDKCELAHLIIKYERKY